MPAKAVDLECDTRRGPGKVEAAYRPAVDCQAVLDRRLGDPRSQQRTQHRRPNDALHPRCVLPDDERCAQRAGTRQAAAVAALGFALQLGRRQAPGQENRVDDDGQLLGGQLSCEVGHRALQGSDRDPAPVDDGLSSEVRSDVSADEADRLQVHRRIRDEIDRLGRRGAIETPQSGGRPAAQRHERVDPDAGRECSLLPGLGCRRRLEHAGPHPEEITGTNQPAHCVS